MTVKEFFNITEPLAIHCNTKEKAIKLCKEFDRLGYKWFSGGSYLENNRWHLYESKTCYTNHCMFSDIYYYQDLGYKILEFEDIELEG